ncbi:non-structural polyprotein 1AB, partial [Mamastrovirus 19]
VFKKRSGPPGRGEVTYAMMRLDAWKDDLDLPTRKVVPEGFPVIGNININRPISDWSCPKDPLLGLLPRAPSYVPIHAPTVWGYDAYAKSFEKFFYAEPDECISVTYARFWDFANRALIKEYGYLSGSHIIGITATVKNVESTPGYPKFKYWKTESEYLEERGYQDYVTQYQDICEGHRPDVLWYLFLKKEILKTEKIEKSDIRQIVCPDPIYARIGAMFEQDQNNRMKSMTRWRQGQCRWSPFEGGFDAVLRRIERVGNKYVEFDWTRYDGTIPVEVFRHIKNFRFSLLDKSYRTETNRMVYDWYVSQLCYRYVLMPSGEVTIQDRGNPSGQISTTMDNNMINTFLQAFEFAYVNGSLDDELLWKLWCESDSIIYGDDRLSSLSLIPDDYVELVVQMYKDVFGMWVKPENVKIFDTLSGVSFCGFTSVLSDGMYLPVPTDAWKFITSTLKPVKALPDFDALVGKILSFQILTHNLPDDDPVKIWFDEAHAALSLHSTVDGGEPIPTITREMRDFLWRGGPKR